MSFSPVCCSWLSLLTQQVLLILCTQCTRSSRPRYILLYQPFVSIPQVTSQVSWSSPSSHLTHSTGAAVRGETVKVLSLLGSSHKGLNLEVFVFSQRCAGVSPAAGHSQAEKWFFSRALWSLDFPIKGDWFACLCIEARLFSEISLWSCNRSNDDVTADVLMFPSGYHHVSVSVHFQRGY